MFKGGPSVSVIFGPGGPNIELRGSKYHVTGHVTGLARETNIRHCMSPVVQSSNPVH